MSFLYPLGLLGLIGIPLLILIYILKNKYTEQVVSSTYIWNLSEKFLKNRRPLSKLSGLISLILQIMIVIAISFIVAQPRLILKNQARDYCFILDGSGSMNTIQGETTRLEIGKNKIEDLISQAVDGSSFTLIHMGDSTSVVYQEMKDKKQAIQLLNEVQPAYLNLSFIDSVGYAQSLFNANSSLITYLVTDKNYSTQQMELIQIGEEADNYAITTANYEYSSNKTVVTGTCISYAGDQTVTLVCYLDDREVTRQDLVLTKNESTAFTFELSEKEFSSIKVEIINVDSLKEDNTYILYNTIFNHSYKTLLVSDRPTYLRSAIAILHKTALTVVSTKEYPTIAGSFDLYIFDSFTPEVLPKTGAVWLFNSTENKDDTGFSFQNVVSLGDDGGQLKLAESTNSIYQSLTKNISGEKLYVSQYVKYGLYRNFLPLLTCDAIPVVFVGSNAHGNRQVVFGFDIHDSNLGMSADFIYLIENLLDYSFPTILDKTNYVCGDVLSVNVLGQCKNLSIITPSNKKTFMDISSITSEYYLTEIGTYEIIMDLGSEQKVFYAYSSLASSESHMEDYSNQLLSIEGEQTAHYGDGFYENLMILLIVLAVIYLADWMVYCYEQHQL